MELHLLEGRKVYGYTQFGSIWEKGIADKCDFYLHDTDGREIPVQSRITAYWPDGSIKWAAHTADSRLMGEDAVLTYGREDCTPIAQPHSPAPSQKDASSADKISCTEHEDGWQFCSGSMSLFIPKSGRDLFRDLTIHGECRVACAGLKLILERHTKTAASLTKTEYTGESLLSEVRPEDAGPLMWSFRFKGTHRLLETGETLIPFILRMRLYRDTHRLDIQHTFLYDGDENTDLLKGIGIQLQCPLKGDTFDRHIRFGTDYGSFHEAASLMLVWDHKHPGEIYDAQIKGIPLAGDTAAPEDNPLADVVNTRQQAAVLPADSLSLSADTLARLRETASRCPLWDHYQLFQDSDTHFSIRKKTAVWNCCFLNALHGTRAKGTMAFGGTNGSILTGLRDFWQKYPSGLELDGLSEETATATVWIYSPSAEAYDFRHYDKKAYPDTCYEGFPDCGATPYGVANTNDCSIEFCPDMIPSEDTLQRFGDSLSMPPLYFGNPDYYHRLKAFGFWSLPSRRSESLRWLEEQLDKAVDFYEKEVENRHWYGLYDYGDIMHTYDPYRHIWRYDIGGYAWQNTELMPTMWLWLAFLRTGRSDILTLAEAMTRHASDVDTYHMGPLKGLGTRHGIRHWGCPCKEIRIGMAGHYRYHYYLLCDRRMEDVFDDVKDADFALLHMDPLRYVYKDAKGSLPTHARSGPDWSAMVSNWMTYYERTLDTAYLGKIRTGMEDIKAAPLGLISGPDFEYDPATGHLRYIGESATGGTHLQVALGGPQIWMELADMLDDDAWKRQIAEYGRFYYLSDRERLKEFGGAAEGRSFLYPIMAAAMAAYGAGFFGDKALAEKTVQYLFRAMIKGSDTAGFAPARLSSCGNLRELPEIPWISTNFTAQWCLNTIMVLEFVSESVPETLEEVSEMLAGFPEEGLFRNC